MLLHCILHGVVHRHALHLLAALSGRDAGHDTPASHLLCVGIHQADMKLALLAGCTLHQDSRVPVAVDHAVTCTAFFTTRSIVSSISYPFSERSRRPSASLVPASRTITFWEIPA